MLDTSPVRNSGSFIKRYDVVVGSILKLIPDVCIPNFFLLLNSNFVKKK